MATLKDRHDWMMGLAMGMAITTAFFVCLTHPAAKEPNPLTVANFKGYTPKYRITVEDQEFETYRTPTIKDGWLVWTDSMGMVHSSRQGKLESHLESNDR